MMSRLRCITHLSILAAAGLFTAECRADFVYAATELSLEWLTDASRAIVVGDVTECDEDGSFRLRVEQLVKRRGLDVAVGQFVEGETLGRARTTQQYVYIAREIGWPSLLDPATYPTETEIFDRKWSPQFRREESWNTGDRCVIFFGRDLQSPLQIINLDRPVHIEVDFLAIDRQGQPVSEAADLFHRIQMRIMKTLNSTGRPRVCAAGSVTWPHGSAIDGDDYYYLLVPLDVVEEAEGGYIRFSKDRAVVASPTAAADGKQLNSSPLQTSTIWHPDGKQTGANNMITPAREYWWHSEFAHDEFAADAKLERDSAVHAMFQNLRFARGRLKDKILSGTVEPADVDQVARDQTFRVHRTNFRTYPLGWRCVLSYDARFIGFVDGFTVQVWEVDPETNETRRLILTRRDAHRARTFVEFSWDSRIVAYTTADNSVRVIDLATGRDLWTARGDFKPYREIPVSPATVAMEFSADHRYLVQQSEQRYAKLGEAPDRDMSHTPQMIHVWDVSTGRSALTPFQSWQSRLKFVAFHAKESSFLRLSHPVIKWDGVSKHEIWNIATQKRLTIIPARASWNDVSDDGDRD